MDNSKKTSRIRSTTTCPYCGKRMYHKNLNNHIKRFHQSERDEDSFFKDFRKKKFSECPYCSEKIEIRKLEDHIRSKHPSKINEIINKHKRKNKKREENNLKRRKSIADEFGAKLGFDKEKDPNAPVSWKLAESNSGLPVERENKREWKPIRKTKIKNSGYVLCPQCGVQVKRKNLSRHLRRVHKGSREHILLENGKEINQKPNGDKGNLASEKFISQTASSTKPRGVYLKPNVDEEYAKCPYCGKQIPKSSYYKHISSKHFK